MIRDTVHYAGKPILTIYHKGFDQAIKYQNIKRQQKIGRYKALFKEEVVPDSELDNLSGWTWILEGLLDAKSDQNPYHEAACAYIKHYIYLEKPEKLFKLNSEEYELNVELDVFQKLNDFAQQYTGLSMDKHPMWYGDVLVYSCREKEYRAKKDEGIVVQGIPANSSIIVNFKKNGIIVCSKKIEIPKEQKEIEILSDKEWNYHDIEIYHENELIYINKDISYIRSIHLNMHITGKSKRIQLGKLAKEYILKNNSTRETSIIGENPDKLQDLLWRSEISIANRLNEKKENDNVIFCLPGELDNAIKIITEVIYSPGEEVWVFDPYISDRGGIGYSLDWLAIVANCNTTVKNIVYYYNAGKDMVSMEELLNLLQKQRSIRDILKTKKQIGFKFYQTKRPIHDRFIFNISREKVSGLVVGTSLNSLHDNLYCIHKLAPGIASEILEKLKEWMVNSNVVREETL